MRIRIPAEVQAKSRVTELGEVSIPGSLPNTDHSTDPGGLSKELGLPGKHKINLP